MLIFDSKIDRVHRSREFGQIEARITFLAKTAAGRPPQSMRIATHVPIRGNGPLRDRLMRDAMRLARLMAARAQSPRIAA